MPLPTPTKGENKNKFVSRCVSDPNMKREYKDKNQRLAICVHHYMKKA